MRAEVTKQDDIPVGTYPAQFQGVEDGGVGEYGPMWRWTFWLQVGNATSKLETMSSATFGTRSKAYKWMSAIAQRSFAPGEVVDFDQYKGHPCFVAVGVNQAGYNRADDVLPAQGGQQQQIPQTPAPAAAPAAAPQPPAQPQWPQQGTQPPTPPPVQPSETQQPPVQPSETQQPWQGSPDEAPF